MVTRLPSRQEVRGQGTVPAPRGQALPDAGDVPQVNPRIAADPGVQAPRGAFGGGEGMVAAGEMLGQAAERLAAAQNRIQARQDVVTVADRTNKANQKLAGELRRLQTESDLSDPDVLDGFGKFADQTLGELSSGLRMLPGSQAELQKQFSNIRSHYADQASVANVQAGRKKVETRIGESLSGLTNIATTDPSQLPALFDSLDATLDIMAPALTPDEEEAFRSTGRAEITLSAVNALLSRGNAEDAESLIQDVPGVLEILTPAKQRELAGRFETIRREKDKVLVDARNKLAEAEFLADRKLTVAERMRLAGLAPPAGKQTAADKIREIEVALERRLLPEERARVVGLGGETPKAATDAGKAIQDREMFVSQYGADSPQVAAFDEATENQGEPPDLSSIAGMRKEFTGLSGSFVQARDAFNRIVAAAQDPSAAGDLALIFNYMKVLDPGSTVREGEFANAQNADGVPGRVQSLYNNLISGERLNDTQRTDFVSRAEDLMTAQIRSHQSLETQFRGLAERAGFDPSDVVVEFVPQELLQAVRGQGADGTPRQAPRYNLKGERVGQAAGTPAGDAQDGAAATETAVPASAPVTGPAPEIVTDGAPSETQGLSDEELLRQLGITPMVGP